MSGADGASKPPASNGDANGTPHRPTPVDGPDPDAALAAYLAACEEALAAGRTPPPCPAGTDDPELRRRLRRARDCLTLIQQLWPRDAEAEGNPGTVAATLGADDTWFEEVDLGFDAVEPAGEDAAGVHFLGRFRIVRELGRGGFGVVFLADDPKLGRRVALKVPLIDVLTRPAVRRRFLNEAKAAAALDHPNLVPVFEAGAIGPVCYIATAYCDGPTLAAWMRDYPKPIRARTAARLVATLAGAMQHVHERGFLHRDLKPSNVLLQRALRAEVNHGDDVGSVEGWVPRITDFGLARVLDGPGEATQSGLPIGSPAYMAPEQAQGRLRDLGPATDVYALGAILYEVLVGRTPHGGETPLETLRQVIADEPSPPRRCRPDLPRDLEAIVLRCLEKDPRRRYATAGALEADLRRFLAGEAISARPVPPYERAWEWARRRPAHAAGLVALALLPVVAIAVLTAALAWQKAHTDSINREKLRYEQLYDEVVRQHRMIERHLHNSEVGLAQQFLDRGNLEDAQNILDGIGRDPLGPLQPDLPGFEDHYDPRGFAWGLLHRQSRREVHQLRGDHDVGVVTPSPDRETLISAGNGRVLLWDLPTGRIRARLSGGELPLADAPTPSPDGHLLAAALADSTSAEPRYRDLGLWDATSGRLIARLNLGTERGSDLATVAPTFLASGRLGALGRDDQGDALIAVWDLQPDPARPRLVVERGGLRGAAFAPGGERFAAVDDAGRLTLHDARTGEALRMIPGQFERGQLWSLSADGRTVAAQVPGRGVVLWEADSGVELACHSDLAGPFLQLLSSPSGQTFALVETSGRVHLLGNRGGRGPSLMPDDMDRPERDVNLAFSPDGTRLALTAYGHPLGRGPIRLFDVADGRTSAVFPGRPEIGSRLAFAPDGRSLWIAGGPTIRRWFPDRGADPAPAPAGHGDEAWAVAFHPDGRTITTGSDDGVPETLTRWNAITGARQDGWRAHPTGTVAAMAYSPDGTLMATAALEISDNLRLWDAMTGELVQSLPGHTGFVRAVAFHPDGTWLASVGDDQVVRVWDVAGRRLDRTLTEPTDKLRTVAFSPDGAMLVAAGNDRRVRAWSVGTWGLLLDLPNAEDVAAVAFSPDGQTLAVADEDGTIQLLDPRRRTVLGVLHHDGELRCLAFSPDGTLLASAGMNGKVYLWDPVAREPVIVLEPTKVQINALAFAPDGLALIASDHDGGLHLWRSDPAP